jgi:tRNA-Thr(GGU) m(6)t(6)A37 methyltransferase TsaA
MSQSFQFDVIGIISSPFNEKFGIPRQPGLAPAATARLELLPPFDRLEALEGIEAYSHLWIQFVFHAVNRKEWKPTVRPPRLGGNRRIGVFASRSTHRPNPLGLSVVELLGVETSDDGHPVLLLGGVDIMDGTPVLDIKPYLPYADIIPEARAELAPGRPPVTEVVFDEKVANQLDANPELGKHRELICQVLEHDPRPAYHHDKEMDRIYGVSIYNFDIRWQVRGDTIHVLEILDQGQE